MSGHSKWAKIKRKKAVTDAKKGASFTKLVKNISIAARSGKDPEMNPALRTAIDQARSANLPKDNIEKAILKGAGELPGAVYEEVVYEGYGPGGAALVIECTTDNTNRTVSFVRSTITKHNGSLGNAGSVQFLFDQKGVIRLSNEDVGPVDLDALELELIDAGIDDMQREDEGVTVYTPRERFAAVLGLLESKQIRSSSAALEYVPKTAMTLSEKETEQLDELIELLEDDDDVDTVFTNIATV